MDKENVKRVIFNFTINNNSKIKNKRHNSKVSVPRYRCKGYCFMYEDNFNSLVKHCNEIKE